MWLIGKNAKAYKYNYTDLGEITKLLQRNGIEYYQYINSYENGDYIMTVIVDPQTGDTKTLRGCKIMEPSPMSENPAQQYGAALTYARRYSLLLAFGLATVDDDGASLRKSKPATLKEIQQYEATCGRKNLDPQTEYQNRLNASGNYKNMTGAQLGLILRMINEDSQK